MMVLSVVCLVMFLVAGLHSTPEILAENNPVCRDVLSQGRLLVHLKTRAGVRSESQLPKHLQRCGVDLGVLQKVCSSIADALLVPMASL